MLSSSLLRLLPFGRRAVIALAVCLASAQAQPKLSGSAEIQLALERLNVTGSALMIAAHPDDENTALLAWLARGRKVRTGYLSLTRGEGGQNVIGSEQGRLLGQIRTQELLAARRIDGAEQYFSRAVDFGFSKTAEETLAKWDRKAVLGDAVWVIRKFRPDVILLRFSGTPRDGHGQHQASAILGKEAFLAAADPKEFPEQLTEVQPWQAKRLLFNVLSFTREQEQQASQIPNRIAFDTGEYDPVLGYSFSEIAGVSRSQHRSQAMGSAERRGSSKGYLTVIAGEPASADLFEGVPLGWERVKGGAAVGPILRKAADTFEPRHPQKVIPLLLEARNAIAALSDPVSRRKLIELDEALALCAGLWVDASANRAIVAPGAPLKITTQAINRSNISIKLQSIRLDGAPGAPSADTNIPLGNNQLFSRELQWTVVPAETRWNATNPEPDPVLVARFTLEIDGTAFALVRPVLNRYVDRIRGEMTRPLTVVPAVSLRTAEGSIFFGSQAPQDVQVEIKAYKPQTAGKIELEVDAGEGWKIDPVSQPFQIAREGEQALVKFRVTPPSSTALGHLAARATIGDAVAKSNITVLNYSHIPQTVVFEPSETKLARSDLKVLAKTVGYVMGAGDEVPGSLRQMGCEVVLLSSDDLARGDLRRFDAIVTGVRAYNVRDDLQANQARLLSYVEAGGTLIVQYNVAEGGPGGGEVGRLDRLGPYPLRVGRDRITVEDAPVELLGSANPLLTTPNKISSADFEGWIQERGLYFPSEWDQHYQTVLACNDPGEKALRGGILYTKYGKGAYVYTSYAWFRQLPAGVPGAYRIFANLLSAGRTH